MNKTISIIIPIYNQMKFFKQCIESVLNQTYPYLEIICVDDGSTDGVSYYIDRVKESDSRVIVVHQENKGESSARNNGLKLATGDYITFVDCDDWIEPQMYQEMMQQALDYDLDLIACSWIKEFNDKSIIIENERHVNEGIFGRDELLEYIYKRDSYRGFAYMWNKLYKRSVLSEGTELRSFDEEIKLGGDVIYLAQATLNVKKAKYIDSAYYHYRIRENSGSHTNDVISMKDWVKSYEITIEVLNNENVDKEIIDYAKRFLAYHAMEGMKVANKNCDEIAKEYFCNVMRDYKSIYDKLNQEHPERVEEYASLLGMMI